MKIGSGPGHRAVRLLMAPLVALAVVGSLLTSAAAAEGQVVLRGGPSAALGAKYPFTATLSNPTAAAAQLTVTFQIAPKSDPAAAVSFHRWSVSVPANGTAEKTLTVTSAQWFEGLGNYRITAMMEGVPASDPLTFEVTKAKVRVPRFSDVTTSVGLASTRPSFSCGRWAAGAAWGDIEGDGDLDLYVPNAAGAAEMWVNSGGRFTNQATSRGVADLAGSGLGATFADYDNDGDPDLHVARDGADRLYQNDGSGQFVDVAAAAGVADELRSQSASWADYDNDGLLDLYVVNYADCDGINFVYDLDKLYHNEGDGTFSDQTALVEHDPTLTTDGSTIGAGFQATWFDYDSDGDVDLYLANDFHGNKPDANHMWRNDGPGADGTWQFTDVSVASGTAYRINAMGTALGDYDRDMDLDFALSNIGAISLARNNGNGTFTEVAEAAGVARADQTVTNKAITWGLEFSDLNLDGWEDLFAAGGLLKTNPDPQANAVFVNTKDGRFVDLSAPSGADDNRVGRGIALADYDADGRMDIYVVNQEGSPILYRNTTSKKGRHWLKVDTIGTRSVRDGCGATVTLTVAGDKMMRVVNCGGTSLSSGSDTTLHFGLGAARTVSKMVIEWPSGTRQIKRDLKVDRKMTVREPA